MGHAKDVIFQDVWIAKMMKFAKLVMKIKITS